MSPYFNREQLVLAIGTMASLLGLGAMYFPWAVFLEKVKKRLPFLPTRDPAVRIAGVRLTDDARVRHTHIVGATGSGKTVLIEQLLLEDLKRGHGCLVIDPKGDRELYERVRSECRRLGREKELFLISATFEDESSIWNPCGLGNVSELQSKFYHSAVYSEPHYAKWCEKALLQAFNRLVVEYPRGFGINQVVTELDRFCRELKSRDEKIEGLFLDFYNLARGEWGPLLGSGATTGRREVRLLDVTRRNQILFVDLPTEAKKVQSARIGRLLTQELMLISGLRKIYPAIRSDRPFSVYIDEFDAFATENFATLLNKARSSQFMIHIAHQTLSDLNRVSPDFAGQVLGNCNVRFIFRQDDPDDAERWARFLGTRQTVKRTYQSDGGVNTGRASNRAVQEFVVAPDTIKGLRVGEAIASIKTDRVTRVVRTRYKRSKAAGEGGSLSSLEPMNRALNSDLAPPSLSDLASISPPQPTSEVLDDWRKASDNPKKGTSFET